MANDDLISRSALGIGKCDPSVFNDSAYGDGWNACIEIIEAAPAVDAVPVVHGRWVKMTGMMPPEYHGHYECSECQWHMKGLRNSWTREEELNFCPNCGARMDGGDADESK